MRAGERLVQHKKVSQMGGLLTFKKMQFRPDLVGRIALTQLSIHDLRGRHEGGEGEQKEG